MENEIPTGEDIPEEMQFFDEEFPRLEPQQHGHIFKNMYNVDDDQSMQDKVIVSVLFDDQDLFSGFSLMSTTNGDLTILSPMAAGDGNMRNVDNDMELVKANKHTRLVGFRTTKRCSSAKQIMSVQPIYFSINEDMCKKVLKPITRGMLEEIPHFGPSCDEIDTSLIF